MRSFTIGNMESFVEKQQPNRISLTKIFLWCFKCIFILIAVAIILVFSYSISLHFKHFVPNQLLMNMTGWSQSQSVHPTEIPEGTICETEECKRKAESLRNSMNTSVDPCEDFYEFACGNWKSDSGGYIQLMETHTQIIWNLIDLVEHINENDSVALQQLKVLYDSCVNFDFEKNPHYVFPAEMWEPGNIQESRERLQEVTQLGLNSAPTTSTRRRNCLRYMEDHLMPYAATHMYVMEHVKYDTLDKIEEMYSHLRTSLVNLVWSLDWMDKTTKQHVADWTQKTELGLGYPGSLSNPNVINECYQGLDLTSGGNNATFPEHLGMLLKWGWESKKNHSWKCTLPSRWDPEGFVGAGPAYLLTYNAVAIPAGIMRQPYFGNGLRAADYGGLGTIMGHELLHGFQWNDGRAIPLEAANDSIVLPKWSSTAKEEFAEKAKCFKNQYDNFWLADVGGNQSDISRQTSKSLREDISDNVGLHIAHQAYKLYLDQKGTPEPRLPTLEQYSGEQFFFLSYANAWCSTTRTSTIADLKRQSEHSPFKYRLIGSMANSLAFSSAWQCPPLSRMNPKMKCNL